MTKHKTTKELASYRQARYNYEILDTMEAGLVLLGTEVKSLRAGGGNLMDNYVDIRGTEAYLRQVHISPYKFGNIHNHEETRPRKLLLHKKEIDKLLQLQQQKGLTLVALSLYLKGGKIKAKIAVCRGKKRHDKRANLKSKVHKDEVRQALDKG